MSNPHEQKWTLAQRIRATVYAIPSDPLATDYREAREAIEPLLVLVADQEAEIARLRTADVSCLLCGQTNDPSTVSERGCFVCVSCVRRVEPPSEDYPARMVKWDSPDGFMVMRRDFYEQEMRTAKAQGERSARTQLEGRIRALDDKYRHTEMVAGQVSVEIGDEYSRGVTEAYAEVRSDLAALLAVSSPQLQEKKEDDTRVDSL